ncbi:MAG: hypothetical protein Q9217_007004 [Psora testacea]
MLMQRCRIWLSFLPVAAKLSYSTFSIPAVAARKPHFQRTRFWNEPSNRPRLSKEVLTLNTNSEMETYNGHVGTPADAIILFEACRLGLLPRVQRRLSEKERQSIKSGSVFVWDEREAGMRRWTDGKSWSASRVSGSFLTYREMEGKRGGGGNGYPPPPPTTLSRTGRTPESTQGSESDLEMGGEEGPDGYRYKPDGLVKQSFSITTSSGNHLHLISYYSRSHPSSRHLNSPSSDPALRQIRPAKGMYPESTVHEHQNIPAVTRSPMASAPYSTVPQMAGYARPGPSKWPPNQSYGWSQPPPQHPQHPQHQYYSYTYAPGPHTPTPPQPTNGHSPLQYSQTVLYPKSGPPDRNYSTYDNRPPPPATSNHDYNQSSYDPRRGPPTSTDHRPPLSLQQQQQQQQQRQQQQQHPTYANGAREAYPSSQYDFHRYPAKSPSAPNHSAIPAQHQRQHFQSSNGVHHSAPPRQAWNPGSLPPPQPTRTTPPSRPHQPAQTNLSSTPIDPQLMGSFSASRQRQSHSNEQSRTPTPSIKRNDSAEKAGTQPNGHVTSTASTIPSINALMNGSSAETHSSGKSTATMNGHTANGYHGYMQMPPERKSPTSATKGKDGPQDIPSEKVGFGEDMRAIKVLDRAFTT